MNKLAHEKLSGRVIVCAIEVHKALGPGFLESTYTLFGGVSLTPSFSWVHGRHNYLKNRFSGLHIGETAKAVELSDVCCNTQLKLGVNETRVNARQFLKCTLLLFVPDFLLSLFMTFLSEFLLFQLCHTS